jgi:signal transduction histidine kinase
MKTVLARSAGYFPVIAILLACAVGVALPVATPSLSTFITILWLLSAGGAICLLLRRAIDADDRTRDLSGRLAREQDVRRSLEVILADTQTVLSKVVRQQESARDSERGRIAREIHDELGQSLLTLRVELSLLQVASNGIHPTVHAKAGTMIGTLDLALNSLRAVVSELRPLALGEGLRAAVERQLDEFTRLNGIAHVLEFAPGALAEPECLADGADALLYRVLQEALADVAREGLASEVRVVLQASRSGLALRMHDNGDGSKRRAPAPCACGLAGMRERVEAIGGALCITSQAEGGTALALTLPCARGMALT